MKRYGKNPILGRDLRRTLENPKTYTALLLLIGILGLTLFMLWPRTGIFSSVDTDTIFSVFLGVNLALTILLAPAFTASAITDEREKRSFELLFTTLLKPSQILIGKLTASVGTVILILIISAPITAICALSGGISIPLLVKAYSTIFLAALSYGIFGLAVSALCSRTFTAVIVSYFGVALLAGATWLPDVLLRQYRSLQPLWHIIRSLSPFEALIAVSQPATYEAATGVVSAAATFKIYATGMLTLSIIGFVIFCLGLMRPMRSRKSKSQQQYTDFKTSLKRRLGFPFYLIDPLRRKQPIGRWRNPVFVAELRSKVFGKPKFILRALAACIVISITLLLLVSLNFGSVFGPDKVRVVAVLFQFSLIVLLAPVVSSGSITEERVGGTIGLLRMTPLTAWTVIWGKLKAAFMYVLVFLLSSLPVLFSLVYLETEAAYWRVGAWLATLVLTALVFIMIGLTASTFMKSTASATALSYAVTLLISVGTLSVLLFGERISEQAKAAFLVFNPVVAAIQITSDEWFVGFETFGQPLWQGHLAIFGVSVVICLLAASLRMHKILRERD
ncbi:MAG: ABC transporter permease subunit [Lentisphaeria bacterium]